MLLLTKQSYGKYFYLVKTDLGNKVVERLGAFHAGTLRCFGVNFGPVCFVSANSPKLKGQSQES